MVPDSCISHQLSNMESGQTEPPGLCGNSQAGAHTTAWADKGTAHRHGEGLSHPIQSHHRWAKMKVACGSECQEGAEQWLVGGNVARLCRTIWQCVEDL